MTLNLCLLPLGSRLKTRDGRSARLLATDLKHARPCVIATDNRLYEEVSLVTASGEHYPFENRKAPGDIVSVEEAV